jgi:hypothetical protein
MRRSVAAATIAAVLGAEVAVVDDVAQPGHGGLHVEAGIVDGRHQQRMPFLQRGARHLLVAGPEHHAVDAGLARRARLAEAGRHAGQIEQLDDHMLEHMAHPGAFLQALQEAAPLAHAAVVLDQVGQPLRQPLVQTRQLVGRVLLQLAEVQPDFQAGSVGPDVGPAQVIDAQQLDVVLGCAHGTVVALAGRAFCARTM